MDSYSWIDQKLYPGDVCIIDHTANNILASYARSLVGKLVLITEEVPQFNKYKVRVIDPDPLIPIQNNPHLLIRADLLRREFNHAEVGRS